MSHLPHHYRNLRRRLAAFCVALLIGINGFVALSLIDSRAERLEQAERQTSNLARSLEEHAARTISALDQALTTTGDALVLEGGPGGTGRTLPGNQATRALLRRHLATVPCLRAILVTDAGGTVVIDSRSTLSQPLSLAQSPSFQALRDGRESGPLIDLPAFDQAEQAWSFTVSRALIWPGGQFAGMISAVVDTGYFREFYAALNRGSDASVSLFSTTGVLYVRDPDHERFAGTDQSTRRLFTDYARTAPSGTYRTRSFDGVRRIVSYRALKDYPLLVSATATERTVFAPWWRELMLYLAILAVADGAVVWFLLMFFHHLRREEQAMTELWQSERRAVDARCQLFDAIESMTEAFLLLDRDDHLVACNSRYRELMGPLGPRLGPDLSFTDLLDLMISHRLVPRTAAEPQEWKQQQLSQHHDASPPVEQQLHNGRWVQTWVFRTSDGGRVQIHHDITPLKHKQFELERQALLLQATMENSAQGLCVFDRAGTLILHNRLWLELLALPETLARPGTPLAEVIRWRARRGDYGPGQPETLAARHLAAVMALGEMLTERTLPGGRVLSIRGVTMADGSRLTTYRDITDAKTAHQALRQKTETLEIILETVDQGIGLFDPSLALITANRRWHELAAACALDLPAVHAEAQARGEICRNERLLADGRAIEWRAGTASSGGGLVVTLTDVSERKRRELELERATEVAERANQIKSLFLATMSHELRTPLNAIIGFSDLIAKAALGGDQDALSAYVGFALDIRAGGQLLLDQVNTILDVSKIEAGRMTVQIERVDLRLVFKACLSLVREEARVRQVRLLDEIDPALAEVRADERAMRQIVVNLLSNALKFTPAGGRVTLKAHATPGGALGGGCVISVSDSGIGIPHDQIERIMLPFEQVDNRYSRSAGGTGLGLYLVKGLTELHGGTLTIESEAGLGTTVTVTLPASAEAPGNTP